MNFQQKVANEEQVIIEILYEDLESFFRKEEEKDMVEDFRSNTARSVKILSDLVGKLLPERNIDIPVDRVKNK